jgi:hypothetical protein
MSNSVVVIELVPSAASSNASEARSAFALAALLVLVALLVALASARLIWTVIALLLEQWWAAVKAVAMLGVAFLLLVMLAIGPPRSSSAVRPDRESTSTAGSADRGSASERLPGARIRQDGISAER